MLENEEDGEFIGDKLTYVPKQLRTWLNILNDWYYYNTLNFSSLNNCRFLEFDVTSKKLVKLLFKVPN